MELLRNAVYKHDHDDGQHSEIILRLLRDTQMEIRVPDGKKLLIEYKHDPGQPHPQAQFKLLWVTDSSRLTIPATEGSEDGAKTD